MKAVVKTSPGPGAELKEVDIPVTGPDRVLVRVLTTSICGTDFHIYEWNQWAQQRIKNLPQIMGHELCGKVVEVGSDVKHIKVGDIISAETHIACGHCFQCLTGNKHICQNVKIFGVDIDGVFAEYAVVPSANAWVVKEDIPTELISVMEPLGNAIHTVLSGKIAGCTVLVIGCGPVGLMSIAVARTCGATMIIATEINKFRLELAKKVGADIVLDPARVDMVATVLRETQGLGVDVVLEMSGNPEAINQGFKVLRPGGRYSILGIPSKPVQLDLANDIVFKYATVNGINGRLMFKTWFQTTRFLASHRLNIEPIITHRLSLEEFEKGMELMRSGNCGKILLSPQ